jgi:hypothetical protein
MNQLWRRLLPLAALALLPQFAHAQYSWLDDKGVRVFSDRPPPPGTPAARILKAPRGFEPPQASADTPSPAPAASAASDWQKRESDFRERSARREKDAQEADAQRKPERDAQCGWARDAQKQLAAGRRLQWKNKKGELEYISDEDRAREQARVQKLLSDCG